MAVDTRNKRASVIGLTLAVRLVLPAPDAAVSQADRQHVAYSYVGISSMPVPWGYGPIVCLENVAATVASLENVAATSASISGATAVEC